MKNFKYLNPYYYVDKAMDVLDKLALNGMIYIAGASAIAGIIILFLVGVFPLFFTACSSGMCRIP